MKPDFSLFLFVFLFITSCNNDADKKVNESDSLSGAGAKTSPLSCYRFAGNNDTISLKLIHIGQSITGTLVYNLQGKDKNVGTIQGKMNGDLLLANYTFMSEGIRSVRQIAFKKEGNSFVEGYGDIETNNDIVIFKNPESLQFNEKFKLIEIDCQ